MKIMKKDDNRLPRDILEAVQGVHYGPTDPLNAVVVHAMTQHAVQYDNGVGVAMFFITDFLCAKDKPFDQVVEQVHCANQLSFAEFCLWKYEARDDDEKGVAQEARRRILAFMEWDADSDAEEDMLPVTHIGGPG